MHSLINLCHIRKLIPREKSRYFRRGQNCQKEFYFFRFNVLPFNGNDRRFQNSYSVWFEVVVSLRLYYSMPNLHFQFLILISSLPLAFPNIHIFSPVTDTFASCIAARSEKDADAAIGNVTGSNAVNVFLGIGLAWLAAALYHTLRGGEFLVNPGNLKFSVILFTLLAFVAIFFLILRRFVRIRGQRGELGGWPVSNWISAIFLVFSSSNETSIYLFEVIKNIRKSHL